MASITLSQAQAQLDAWLAASLAVAQNQEYDIDTGNARRRLQRADAAEIRQQVAYWRRQVDLLTPPKSGGRRRVRYVGPD